MVLSWIRTSGFRNLVPETIRLDEGVNAFIGSNAQGKTNILEAIALLANGRSFRGARIFEMIREGQAEAGIEGRIGGMRESVLKIYMNRSSRQYHIDNQAVSDLREFLGCFSYVVFSAECMAIVDGDPGARRNFLDHGFFSLKPSYLLMLRSFRKILKSRNATIRQFSDNEHLVATWNEPFSRLGATIALSRLEYLRYIRTQANEAHAILTDGKEQLDLQYISQWLSDDQIRSGDQSEIQNACKETLETELGADIRRGATHYGPHRDDLRILINGKDIRYYGSRGQKRTALMALKLGELGVFYQNRQEYPVFLLDDIASELDRFRQTGLIRALPENIQIVITHTDTLGGFFDRPVRYFEVSEGCVTGCT